MDREEIINRVLERVKKDIEIGDMTAIERLVETLPVYKLMDFLSERD